MPAPRDTVSVQRVLATLGFAAAAFAASPAHAGIVFDLVEVEGQRVTTMKMYGSFNTAALGSPQGSSPAFNAFYPSDGAIASTGGNTQFYSVNVSAWQSFGNGGRVGWTSSSGDAVALFGDPVLGLPDGYLSGNSLFASASVNYFLSDIGLAPGTYVNVLTNNGVSDTITINIRQVPAVPEPGTYAMLLAGLGVIACIARRRVG